jgi:hypothetical protein
MNDFFRFKSEHHFKQFVKDDRKEKRNLVLLNKKRKKNESFVCIPQAKKKMK